MGGGDLNLKKNWHPTTRRNLEIVWQLEQERSKEKLKVKQLEKELNQRRYEEESDQISNKKRKKVNRIEWMYAPTAFSQQTVDKKHTDTVQPAINLEKGQSSKNDYHAAPAILLKEDPLFKMLKKRP